MVQVTPLQKIGSADAARHSHLPLITTDLKADVMIVWIGR